MQNTKKLENGSGTRKLQRLSGFDYCTCGVYFITFNVIKKEYKLSCITGKPGDGLANPDTVKCYLTEYGRIAQSQIEAINSSGKNVRINEYVIMPNHIHMIIEISDKESNINVSRLVGLLKRNCNRIIGENIWQKSFYDHIITDDEDYYNHLLYIKDNPKKWLLGKDKYYE